MSTYVNYGGFRYPVHADVPAELVRRVRRFDEREESDFVEFTTTDGREIILRIGPSFPIAFETDEEAQELTL